MNKLLLIIAMLLPSIAMANHHVNTSTFNDYVSNQSVIDSQQDVYASSMNESINQNASIFDDSFDRLEGAVAINAANSSIYMAAKDGLALGVGVGGYGDAVAISAKLGSVSKSGSAVSFNAGVSDVDKRPVIGLGVSHSFQ